MSSSKINRTAAVALAALAALARWPWIDGARMGIQGGSYGGQLTDWIITRTNRFEGHGVRETQHVADLIERSMAWYDRWFAVRVQP